MTWLEMVGVASLVVHAPIGAYIVAMWLVGKALDYTGLTAAVLAAYRQHLERKMKLRAEGGKG